MRLQHRYKGESRCRRPQALFNEPFRTGVIILGLKNIDGRTKNYDEDDPSAALPRMVASSRARDGHESVIIVVVPQETRRTLPVHFGHIREEGLQFLNPILSLPQDIVEEHFAVELDQRVR